MIYRGFNEVELRKITEILDRNGVHYSVSVPDEHLNVINDSKKRVTHKFMDSLLQIEIEKSEFDKINEKDRSRLFDLRIYPEEVPPFTEEELANLDKEPGHFEIPNKPDEHTRLRQIATLLAVLVMAFLYLMKRKMF